VWGERKWVGWMNKLKKETKRQRGGCSMDLNQRLNDYIIEDNLNGVNEMIEKGCDINAIDAGNFTPLRLAAINGKYKIVSALIQAKANVNDMVNNKTSILFDVLRLLSNSELHYIIMKQLLEANASVNDIFFSRTTPLSFCCACYSIDSIVDGRLLMNYGAKLELVPSRIIIPNLLQEHNTTLLRRVATSCKSLCALLWCSRNGLFPALRGIIIELAKQVWAQRGGEGCGPRGEKWL
jgi:ankyrin repeat protein